MNPTSRERSKPVDFAKPGQGLLNEWQVAVLVGMSVATVRRWRLQGKGPQFIRVSAAAVRYKIEDVAAWLESRPTGGEVTPRMK